MVVGSQPEDQFAFHVFAILCEELRGALQPPFMNAAIANQIASIEKRSWIRAA
jgi:hypothetical protein